MKKFLLLILVFAFSSAMFAKKVDKEEARTIAGVLLPERPITDVISSQLFEYLYIFNCGDSFVIVSADDCYNPIIAYSADCPFVVEDMPDNIR